MCTNTHIHTLCLIRIHTMKLNKHIDNITIDIISARLKNVVKPLDIIKWLNNFEDNELKYAIDIASNLTVYTANEIVEILNQGFFKLFKTLNSNDFLIIHPVGKFGKSGSMITYFFQKTNFYNNYKSKINMSPVLNNITYKKNINYTLVLLDDFVGSGNSIDKYYKDYIIGEKSKFQKINFIGISGMDYGVKVINSLFDSVEIPKSNIFKKAFSSKASYFGYRNYSEHRKLSYKYGALLTKPRIRKDKTKKFEDALGYQNSQALVSFAHGSPNNTLPIIWANKNNWNPLIPRYFSDKINLSKEFRKNISYELSILKEFGSENLQNEFFTLKIKKGKKTFSSVSKIDFSIYAIIKLIRAGYTTVNICQKLGILTRDYEDIIRIGKKRGVFDQNEQITIFGLELFQDAKKCIERKKKNFEYEKADYLKIRNVNYLPSVFNGKS